MASRADSNRRPLVPRSVSAKTYADKSVDIRPSSPLPATTQAAGRRGQDNLGPHRARRFAIAANAPLSTCICLARVVGRSFSDLSVRVEQCVRMRLCSRGSGVARHTVCLGGSHGCDPAGVVGRQGRFFGSQDCCPDRTSSALTPSTLLRAYLPATNARTRTTLAMGAPAAAQLRQTNTRTLASSPTPYGTCSGDAALWRVTLVSRATPGLRIRLCYGVK